MGQYQQAPQKQGVTQSMSKKGNCLDNAVMENWFGVMKTEFCCRKRFESVESFKTELQEYIPLLQPGSDQTKTKGMKPDVIPNSIPRANLINLSNFGGSVQRVVY